MWFAPLTKMARMEVRVRENVEMGFDFCTIEEKLGIGYVEMGKLQTFICYFLNHRTLPVNGPNHRTFCVIYPKYNLCGRL